MSMYNDYTFEVKSVHPSGLLQYQSGKASSTRTFIVECEYAEELALRLLGKFYKVGAAPEYLTPILPAPFPFDTGYNTNNGQLNMVATGFSIEPYGACCFNVEWPDEEFVYYDTIQDPTSRAQMEKYWRTARGEETIDNSGCLCKLTVTYEENPCDCMQWSDLNVAWSAHAEVLPGTCISSERNPSYEMFTLPNAGLVWLNIPDGNGQPTGLKADSYAYKIIPKADIIVHWHNVPVGRLCSIENHLKSFRGCVNQEEWGNALNCDSEDDSDPNPSVSDEVPCRLYEPETILFIDWQEDRSKRTDAFGGNINGINMNTTTLKLMFKQKRVEFEGSNSNSVSDDNFDPTGDGNAIAGWNHLFTDNDFNDRTWMRVVVKSTLEPIFPRRAFSDIFYPVL